MMKYKVRNSRGISLISLTLTVIILVILTNILIYNVQENLKIERLENMQSDISNLRDKILTYYAQNGKIPMKLKYTNQENLNKIKETGLFGANDTGDFYIIDLQALDNLTLNYGEDYKNISSTTTEDESNTYTDLYIINETSFNIFYVQGIENDKNSGEIFYTNYLPESIDTEKVDLRYVDNVKIPEGYSYVEGTINNTTNPIRIQNINNNAEYCTWVPNVENIENIIVGKTILKDGESEIDTETFKNSAIKYNGYYISNDSSKLICLGDMWSQKYDQSAVYKDENGNKIKIPQGFQVCMAPGKNTVEEGLVVKNSITNDRYVWIEVPKSMTASATNDNEIEKALQEYTTDYRKSGYTDEWYDGSGETASTSTNLEDKTGCGLTSTEYANLKSKMLNSIKDNGGFWIGQYEMGTDTARVSKTDALTIPVCKEGAYPYNYITCSQAQERASLLSTGEYTSSLMFGIQWDLVCKFLEIRGELKKVDINSDSGRWGNYIDVTFDITKGKYSENYGKSYTPIGENAIYSKKSSKDVLLTTGVVERNCKLNIYDLAGNDWEWTLEKTPWSNAPCTDRGGGFDNIGSEFAVSRRVGNKIDDNGSNVSFRSTLY